MSDVTKIVSELGIKQIAAQLCIGETAVMNARSSGKFPASWFDAIDTLCIEKGIECPRSLFKFKTSADLAVTIGNEVAA